MQDRGKITRREWLLIAVLFCGIAFRIVTFPGVELGGYDEGRYLVFVQTLGEHGIEGLRSLIAATPQSELLQEGPRPLRILYVGLGLLACRIAGEYSFAALAWVSLIAGIGTIALGTFMVRRLLGMNMALATAGLLAFSPLATGMARRALLDAPFALAAVAAIWAFHRAWYRPDWLRLSILGIVLLAGWLIKESMAFVYIPMVAIAAYYRFGRSSRTSPRLLVPLLAAPALAVIPWAWTAGGFRQLIDAYVLFVRPQIQSEYVIRLQSGPWFRYLVDLMLLSPVTTLLAVMGFGWVLARREEIALCREGRLTVVWLVSGFLPYSLMAMKNVRFALYLDVPLRILAAIAIFALMARWTENRKLAWTPWVLLLIVVCSDAIQFWRIFIVGKVYDPVTIHLIRANGLFR
jgi:4-amino-4-deoxy-L-arabinose transferase-like glycosyltransferase